MSAGAARIVIVAALVLTSCRFPEPESRPSRDIWDPSTGRFHWPQGEVTLPKGLIYSAITVQDLHNIRFMAPGGGPSFVAVIPDCKAAEEYRTLSSHDPRYTYEEFEVRGARVQVARFDLSAYHFTKPGALGVVTFRDSGCATFVVFSMDAKDVALVDSVVRSYRPATGHQP